MGMDVDLYIRGDVTDQELAAAAAFIAARSPLATFSADEPCLARTECDDDDHRVEYVQMSRYYGPWYERGDWPSIYGAIRCMQAAFPGPKVYYGSDTADFGSVCSDEFLAGMWEHYLGPHGADYRRSL